jgi:hypothetical protein
MLSRTNEHGTHTVTNREGVHFKTNNDLMPLDPSAEHAMYTFHDLLFGGITPTCLVQTSFTCVCSAYFHM